MKQRYFPVLIGAGLLVSGSIITGLANADMDDASHKRDKFMAKKLDINNDGMISLEELTSRQLVQKSLAIPTPSQISSWMKIMELHSRYKDRCQRHNVYQDGLKKPARCHVCVLHDIALQSVAHAIPHQIY